MCTTLYTAIWYESYMFCWNGLQKKNLDLTQCIPPKIVLNMIGIKDYFSDISRTGMFYICQNFKVSSVAPIEHQRVQHAILLTIFCRHGLVFADMVLWKLLN